MKNLRKNVYFSIKGLFKKFCFNTYFYKIHHYRCNLEDPKSFNEKLAYRLFNGNQLSMSNYCDKLESRRLVKNLLGEEYLTIVYGEYDKLKVSDFDDLPEKFVIKTNFGTGKDHVEIIQAKSEANLPAIVDKFNYAMRLNWYNSSLEYFYSLVNRKIFIEEFIEPDDNNSDTPNDLKFHCFNNSDGFKCYIQVDRNRFTDHRRNIYNSNWEIEQSGFNNLPGIDSNDEPSKPNKLKELLRISKKLSENFGYVRLDFYVESDRIFFGEITLIHKAALGPFNTIEDDYLWGSLWNVKNDKAIT